MYWRNVDGIGGEGLLNMNLFCMEKDVFIFWVIGMASSGMMSEVSLVSNIIFILLDDVSTE